MFGCQHNHVRADLYELWYTGRQCLVLIFRIHIFIRIQQVCLLICKESRATANKNLNKKIFTKRFLELLERQVQGGQIGNKKYF